MPYILFLCGDYLDSVKPCVADAARYLRERGQRVELLTEGEQAAEALKQEAPDVLVATQWVPPHDVFAMSTVLRRHHPRADTKTVLLVHAYNSLGEPSRYWPHVFHSYVMAAAGHWQIILAVEQLLHLDVGGVIWVQPEGTHQETID